MGTDDNQIAQWKQTISSNPSLIDALDVQGQAARAKLASDVHVVGPGAALAVGGNVTYSQPNTPKVLAVPNADGGRDVITVDPNNPRGGAPGAGGSAPLTVDTLRPHLVQQESGGNYGAVNKETGALGRYQVMPATARALASRLGMAYRPDMMQGTSAPAMRYQDAIGDAAMQEAIDNSNGDPRAAASYYYSGDAAAFADPAGNPKTAKYVEDMMGRLSGRPPATEGGARTVYSTSGPSKRVRAATQEELAQYPEGTAGQIDANGKLVNLKMPPVSTTKQTKAVESQTRVAKSTAEGLTRLGSFVDSLAKDPAIDSATGNIFGRLPTILLGQGAVDFERKLANLKQNIGLTSLQQFKSLSSTGASGFGNLSNEEGRRLEAMFGVLDRTASPQLIRNTLAEISNFVKDHNMSIKAGLSDMNAEKGGSQPPSVGAKAYKKNAQGQITATVEWNGRGWVPVRN